MKREEDKEENIYANVDPTSQPAVRTETTQHKGSDCVKMETSRAVPMCLALLCFLLLIVVIVLCVLISTNNTSYTYEKNQLLTRITNITEERDEIKGRNSDVTKERDQLLTRNTEVTKERDQLLTRNTEVTKERDQLLTRNRQLTTDKEELSSKREQLNQEKNELLKMDGWIYYKYSVYFISSEKKSWTESRRYCTERGADLIIITTREKQDFVKKISDDAKVWIGLNDRDVEGRWKWVDGSSVTVRLWDHREPNGGVLEGCALNCASGWADYPCNDAFKWICEKNIFK